VSAGKVCGNSDSENCCECEHGPLLKSKSQQSSEVDEDIAELLHKIAHYAANRYTFFSVLFCGFARHAEVGKSMIVRLDTHWWPGSNRY
jgi:hypothetical protein